MQTTKWQASVYLFIAVFLSVSLIACGGGGGTPGNNSPIQAINHIEVSPGSVLLTQLDESVQLSAIAYDANGQEVAADVTWESSDPAVIFVDDNGVATWVDAVGSAIIIALSGDVTSNAVLALAATPAVGAVLISDEQVSGDFILVDPDAPWGLGVQYRVTLTGIDAPDVGTILVGTGEQPIGGRVISATTVGSSVLVTLEMVGLDELFDLLVINEVIDLSQEGFNVAQVIANNYDISEEANGDILFILKRDISAKSDVSAQLIATSLIVQGTNQLNPDANLGPFTCTSTLSDPLVLDAFPGSFTISKDLSLIAEYDSRDPEKLKRLGVDGKIEAAFKVGTTLTAALEGKVECKVKLIEIPLLSGPVGMVLGAFMPIGAGFELGGKLQLAQVGFELNAKAEAHTQFGIQFYNGVGYKTFATAEQNSSADFKWITPTMPTDIVAAYSNLRLEPTLMGFGFADLEAGLKWRVPNIIRKYSGMKHLLRAKVFTAKAGVKQSGNFAIVEGQIDDTDYKSKYSLDLEFTAGVGETIDNFLGLLQITLLKDLFKFTDTLATSPTADKVEADMASYELGGTVGFTVTLESFNTTYPIIGYNVDEILIYRKPDPDSGSNLASLITSLPASNGQTDFSYLWTADKSGSVAGNFFAFVKTKALPFDYFGELELGAFVPPGRAKLIIGQDDPFLRASYAGVEIHDWSEIPSILDFESIPTFQECDGCAVQVIGDLVDWCEGTGGIAGTSYAATVDFSSSFPKLAGASGYWRTEVIKFNGGQEATITVSGTSATPAGAMRVSSGIGWPFGDLSPFSIYIPNDSSGNIPLVVSWSFSGSTNHPAPHSNEPGGWGGVGLYYELFHYSDSCLLEGSSETIFFSGLAGSNGTQTINIPPGNWRVAVTPVAHVEANGADTAVTTSMNGWIKFNVP